MDGIVGGVPASGPSGWQGGEVFSEVQRWNRIEADGQMKTPCGCNGLTSILIPKSVTNALYYSHFSTCSNLYAIIVEEDNSGYSSQNGLLLSKNGKTLISGVNGDVVIPDCVTGIGAYAFDGHCNLTSVTIPDSIMSVGSRAFRNCSNLKRVSIPNSLTSIPYYAFYNCSDLTDITIPDSVMSVGRYAFYGCSSLTSLSIPDSVTDIGLGDPASYNNYYYDRSPFDGCSGLTNLRIPQCVCNYRLRDVFPSAIVPIMKNIVVSENVTNIAVRAFENFDPRSWGANIIIPDSLKSVVLPDGITNIKGSTFSGHWWLENVTIPNSVTSIGYSAFFGCSGLSDVVIPDSVTSIGDAAFSGCSGLSGVVIPDSVTNIGDSAFNCGNLTSVTVPQYVCSSRYASRYFFSSNFYSYYGSITNIILSINVTNIVSGAFSGFYTLSSVTLPRFTHIEEGAFPSHVDFRFYDHEVIFNSQGGSLSEHARYLASGEQLGVLPIPTRHGYDFAGWWTTADGGMEISSSVTVTSNMIYYAHWNVGQCDVEEPKYIITFDANGGYGGTNMILKSDTVVTAPTVTRNGYVFIGWSPSVPFIMPAEDVTCTAQWRPANTFSVTFDLNGGSGGRISEFDYGKAKIAPAVSRKGYDFIGWSPSLPSGSPASGVIYTAQWKPATTISAEVTGDKPVTVEKNWAEGYPLFEALYGDDFSVAVTQKTGKVSFDGTPLFVWQDYVAGTDPTNPNDLLRATIAVTNDMPYVSWTPNLNTNGEVRVYTVMGKTNLTDAAWICPTNSGHRFFKVKVEMP